ncbi:MAG: molybdopterin-synthase adenylyltransferase MoeB [Elusimicrobiota bacterium]|jgi:adenylyltransferase/sulfurtransferase|nr:molybdopterin-synthase adenylyltransferase MoeB [Elusimicrobiota bacterium]
MSGIISDDRVTDLSKEEILRYGRHLILPEINIEGQKKLKAAKVLIVGVGGLGSPVALYLAAAGIGTLGLVDPDFVEESNLQRQIIHSSKDIDRPKTSSAKDKIQDLNPFVNVVTYNSTINSSNALDIAKGYDLIIDGTDNFQTRYLVNDVCVLLGIPNVYGSIFQFEGQASVFYAKEGPCYRCLLPAPPPPGLVPSCAQGGVLGVLPGIIGSIQAVEAIKLITGAGTPLIGKLLLFEALEMKFSRLRIEKDPNCPICGNHPTITKLIDYEEFCGLKTKEKPVDKISPLELKKLLDAGKKVQIIDIREPHEQAIFKFPQAKYIPFGQLLRRKNELDEKLDAIFICKIGQKSVFAIRLLQNAGYKGKLFNLDNGVNGWAEVDPSAPLY